MFKLKKVLGLGLAVAATSMFMISCTEDEYDDAYVRFTWEASQQSYITAISASYNDVKDWYDNVYMDIDFDDLSMFGLSHGEAPMREGGSKKLPNNIYSSTIGSTEYKGKYLEIEDGEYTAICSGEDEYGYFDIVANYEIWSKIASLFGDFKWFEIAFDVDDVLNGSGLWAWDDDFNNNPNTTPMLTKATITKRGTKLSKSANGTTMNVNYYVIRRPKK
jgi:hypothetical protein